MYKKSEEGLSQVQSIGSFLGFLLPILQLFINLLPGSQNKNTIFLIKDQFFFISIFAALISYILIIIARNNLWFQVAINRKAHKKYQEHLAKQDSRVFDITEIQTYLKGTPYVKKPFYINPDNIFTVTLPITVISFLAFFAIGLSKQSSTGTIDKKAIFFQAIFYVLLIAFTALTLAIYYIRDLNQKRWTQKEKGRVSDVIKLAYESNAFSELPHIRLIAQWPLQQSVLNQHLFLFKVDNRFYKIITDSNVDKIEVVESFDQYQSMVDSIKSQENEQ